MRMWMYGSQWNLHVLNIINFSVYNMFSLCITDLCMHNVIIIVYFITKLFILCKLAHNNEHVAYVI